MRSSRHACFRQAFQQQLTIWKGIQLQRRACSPTPFCIKQNHTLNDLQGSPPFSREEDFGRPLDKYLTPDIQLMEQTLALDSREMTLIVPRSSDAVIDRIINSGNSLAQDAYWSRAWPSAVALAKLLLKQPELVRNKRVCEIGAGLGISGIAAAWAGASQVVLTDREPLALECACLTASASGIPDVVFENSTSASDSKTRVVASVLDWTARDHELGKFDVVMACDILYEEAAVRPVAELIPRLLNSSDGCFILADPKNRTQAHREAFLQLLLGNKRHPMAVEFCQSLDIHMDNTVSEIQVLALRANKFGETLGIKIR